MMAPSHAMMGAGGGLGVGMILNLPTPLFLLCVVMCAGAALVPDGDHTKSTFRYTFGWFGKWFTAGVENVCALVYRMTRTSKDADRQGGHRTLTHTILFQFALGAAVWWLCTLSVWAQYVTVFMLVALCLRGIFAKGLGPFIPFSVGRPTRRSFIRSTLKVSRLSAIGIALAVPALQMAGYIPLLSPFTVGFIVTTGGLIHMLGDYFTNTGVPALWPVPVSGQMWKRYRFYLNFNTGGDFEMDVVAPLIFFVVAISLGIAIYSLI